MCVCQGNKKWFRSVVVWITIQVAAIILAGACMFVCSAESVKSEQRGSYPGGHVHSYEEDEFVVH